MTGRHRSERGASLIEVLVGSVIGAVLVAGLMAAFLTALRISESGSGNVEAASLAQQTLERFRNMIACGQSNPVEWFDTSCNATSLPPPNWPDPLAGGAMYGGTRVYTVTPDDCDGVGGAGDCFKVVATVSWTQPQ